MSEQYLSVRLAQQIVNILANIKAEIASGRLAEDAILRANLVLDCALERGGEKLEYGKGSTVSADDVRGILAPKPAPATVERYDAFKFERSVETYVWTREPIGEVVATRRTVGESQSHWWDVSYGIFTIDMSEEQYRAFVEHNTKSGLWERHV